MADRRTTIDRPPVRRLLARVLLALALLLPVLVPVQALLAPVLLLARLLPVLAPVPALLAPVPVLPALGPNPPMGRRQEPKGQNCQSKTLTSQN
jgi:hypothetical protein